MSDQVTQTETATPEPKSLAVPSVMPGREAPAAKESQPVESASEDTEAEINEEESATSDDEHSDRQKNRGVGKRISELTKEKHQARRERDAVAQENEQLRRELDRYKAPQQQPATQAEGKPTLEGCDWDYEVFTDRMEDWKHSQRTKQEESQRRNTEIQGKISTFQERAAAYEEANPDVWNEALNAPIQYTPAMYEVIVESDVGPEIGVYLSQHLDEAEAISRMGPIAAARALGKIESGLMKPPADPKPVPKKLTNTPPPAKTLKAATQSSKDVDSMSTADRIAYWRSMKQSR